MAVPTAERNRRKAVIEAQLSEAVKGPVSGDFLVIKLGVSHASTYRVDTGELTIDTADGDRYTVTVNPSTGDIVAPASSQTLGIF